MKIQGSKIFCVIPFFPLLVILVGCGGGDSDTGQAKAAPATYAGNGAATAAVQEVPANTCPLSAAEVSEVLGVTVRQDEGICMFEPEPGKNPTVTYVRQVSFACSEAVIADPDFGMQPFDGLGMKAYASPSGNDLLVCTSPPFEITVDISPSLDDLVVDSEAASAAARAAERSAAEQLARLILGRQ